MVLCLEDPNAKRITIKIKRWVLKYISKSLSVIIEKVLEEF